MTDWADEIARQLTDALMYNGGKNWDHITLALRKAKADGMREAAQFAVEEQKIAEVSMRKEEPGSAFHWESYGNRHAARKLEKKFVSRANAIEKGTE